MTEVKEHPILFSGPMVRAILEGRKTQTRRVIKPQPGGAARFSGCDKPEPYYLSKDPGGIPIPVEACGKRYGFRGDRLWVRETWCVGGYCDGGGDAVVIGYRADDSYLRLTFPRGKRVWDSELRVSGPSPDDPNLPLVGRWAPSIHMFRWASRILLEITDIRVERLQDISENDARAEGSEKLAPMKVLAAALVGCRMPYEKTYREGFARLWDSLNAKRGFSWGSNPWVWAITFKRLIAKGARHEAI